MNDNKSESDIYELPVGEWVRQEIILLCEFIGWTNTNRPDIALTVEEWEAEYRVWHDAEHGEVPKSLTNPVEK
jgi:hypothetical protein